MPSKLKLMKKLALHWKILIALALGVLWAILSTVLKWNSFTLDYISPWGTIFINLLKLIAIPLVLFSVIKGMMDLKDVGRLGRMGLKTLGAYLITTVFAVCLGLLAVNALKPGNAINQEQRVVNRMSYELWLGETQQVSHDGLNYLENPEYAELKAVAGERLTELNESELVKSNSTKVQAVKKSGPLQFLVDMVPSNIFLALNDTLMLQVIFFAIFFGITLVLIPSEKAAPVNAFVDSMNEVFLKMVDVIMQAAPYFVFCLMAGKMVEMAGTSLSAMVEVFKGLGAYMLVVILALLLMIVVVYPLLFAFLAGRKRGFSVIQSYVYLFRGIGPAQLLAFSTSSSAATLPVTMDCVHERLEVDEDVSSFVLPIGATVNMDGTSLYQAVAVVFLAQMHLVDLDFTQQLTIVLTATLASIGSAAVPSAGLIMMMLVLESVGLPAAWIAIVFPVDRLLDMCRTVVNVTGDATVCSIIGTTEKRQANA
jgi:Na+/H+-dicarboxylate symporter